MVFFYHAALPIPALRLLADDSVAHDFYETASQAGGLGVAFFFVLSGFILTWTARDDDSATRFLRRRLVKIYPNYVLAWCLAMLLFAASYTPVGTAITNLFMLQVWVPDFQVNFSVDPPSWSLGTEFFFYALFPLVLLGVKRIAAANLKYWACGVGLAVLATPVLVYLVLPSAPAIPNEPTVSVVQYWVGYILPPTRLLDFVLGILVARMVMAGRWRGIGMVPATILLVGAYVLSAYLPYLYGQSALFVIPAALLIAAVAVADIEGRWTPFRNRFMTWLGEVSFAFYLFHFIVLATLRMVLGEQLFSPGETVALLCVALLVSVAVSGAVYTVFERPITRRWSSPKRPKKSQSSEPAESSASSKEETPA